MDFEKSSYQEWMEYATDQDIEEANHRERDKLSDLR